MGFLFRLALTKIGGKTPRPPGGFHGILLYFPFFLESKFTSTFFYSGMRTGGRAPGAQLGPETSLGPTDPQD